MRCKAVGLIPNENTTIVGREMQSLCQSIADWRRQATDTSYDLSTPQGQHWDEKQELVVSGLQILLERWRKHLCTKANCDAFWSHESCSSCAHASKFLWVQK